MVDLVELYTHWNAGRSVSELGRSLGLDRKTIRKYLAPAVAAGMVPGGQPVDAQRWRELADQWFPGLGDRRIRQITWPEFEEHSVFIVGQLSAGVDVATVHQRLRDEKGVRASESSLRRWVNARVPREIASPTAPMPTSAPGELGEVDYGLMGTWDDPHEETRHRINAFTMVLPFSKMIFVYPTRQMDQRAWNAAHVAAFDFFDGVPTRITPDNLKTGVAKPSLYDPKINRSYQELTDHYGLLVDPARVRSPRDKPHVERAVRYTRDSWWKGRNFDSLEQMRHDAERWCRQVAACRQSRALDGQTPWEVFEQIERPALMGLPATRFTPRTWHRAKVASDCHVQVDGCRYSVPYRLVGQTLDVCLKAFDIEFYHEQALVKTHVIRPGSRRITDVADYPPNHAAYLSRDPAWCRKRAEEIGPACLEVICRLMEPYALHHLRSCQGILGFATKHGPASVEAACQTALTVGDPTYQTIKGLLQQGLPTISPRPNGDNGAGGILRGPAAFTL